MTVAFGCDHGGFEFRSEIIKYLKDMGYTVKDFGTYEGKSVDYPDVALPVAQDVAAGKSDFGILICGTGIGMSLAANKVPGIRAAAVSDHFSTKYTRLHNNANILCLGARVIGIGTAKELIHTFLKTKFEGGDRHSRRISKITEIENRYKK